MITETPPLDECSDCLKPANSGLCHFHVRDVVPQPAINGGWLKMIGEQYTCDGKACGQGEHLACLAVADAVTPRAGCECHSCGQRRQALKHERAAAKVDPVKARKHEAQKRRAVRRKVRKETKARKTGPSRLVHCMLGGFAPSRPVRSVA